MVMSFLILFNPHDGLVGFQLPEPSGERWNVALTTAAPERTDEDIGKASNYDLEGCSLVLLRSA